MEVLPESDRFSVEEGLRYANNEVCYPATLIVGDLVKALKSGRYDPEHTAVAITQTGGQCRASNYLALIKTALVDAGFRMCRWYPWLSEATGPTSRAVFRSIGGGTDVWLWIRSCTGIASRNFTMLRWCARWKRAVRKR